MSTIDNAIAIYGTENQLLQFCEECAEVIAAVNHYRRGKCSKEHLINELGDLDLMIRQARKIFKISPNDYLQAKSRSLNRLRDKLNHR